MAGMKEGVSGVAAGRDGASSHTADSTPRGGQGEYTVWTEAAACAWTCIPCIPHPRPLPFRLRPPPTAPDDVVNPGSHHMQGRVGAGSSIRPPHSDQWVLRSTCTVQRVVKALQHGRSSPRVFQPASDTTAELQRRLSALTPPCTHTLYAALPARIASHRRCRHAPTHHYGGASAS